MPSLADAPSVLRSVPPETRSAFGAVMVPPSPTSDVPTANTGAYGLAIELIDRRSPAPGLQCIPGDLRWPTVRIRTQRATAQRPRLHDLRDDAATVLLIDDEHIAIRRQPPEAVFHLQHAVRGHELVHPYLAGAAGVFSTWYGRMAFHAGGIVVGGRVWAVLGAKEAGKTTTLVHLHLRGVPIVTDDLLVISGSTVLAGPRSLDLRPPTMEHLDGVADRLDVLTVRDGERFRVTLPPVPLELPFGGWVLLEDGPQVGLRTVPPHRRFDTLAGDHLVAGQNQHDLLDLLSAPMWVLSQPRNWATLPRALDTLLRRLGS